MTAWYGDEGWERFAACSGSDALFFGPHLQESKSDRETREAAAKAICAACRVIEPCREYAIASGELYGVWGGLGEAERRTLIERYGGARVS